MAAYAFGTAREGVLGIGLWEKQHQAAAAAARKAPSGGVATVPAERPTAAAPTPAPDVSGHGSAGRNSKHRASKKDDELEPALLEALQGKRVTQVSAGEAHTAAVTAFGDLFAWGRGFEGQLGTGDRRNRDLPVNLSAAVDYEKMKLAECGSRHTLAVSDAGKVYQWGELHRSTQEAPTFGFAIRQVGMTDEARAMIAESSREYLQGNLTAEQTARNNFGGFASFFQSTPLLVEPLLRHRVTSVGAGYAFSAAVTDQGLVFSWGFNEKGQLGLGHRFNQEHPRLVESLAGGSDAGAGGLEAERVVVEKVACGQQHMLLLAADGDVYSCGLGVFGQLGHGRLKDELAPRRIEAFDTLGVAPQAQAGDAAVAGAAEGRGGEDDGEDARRGRGSSFSAAAAAEDSLPASRATISQLACGTFYSMAVSEDGRVFAFGHSEYGQHGGSGAEWSDWATGTREDADSSMATRDESKLKDLFHAIPRVVTGLEGHHIEDVICGNLHTLAVSREGVIYSWGWGASGCLGHGSRRMCLAPTPIQAVQSGERVVSVAAGWKHTVIVTAGHQHKTTNVDLRALIADTSFADMAFELDGPYRREEERERFSAHKVIVYARCPRIKTLLMMDTRFGYNDHSVDDCALYLKGVRKPVLMQLMQYLYCDYIKAPAHIARELAPLARRLALPRLEAMARAIVDPNTDVPASTWKEDLAEAVDDEVLSDVCFEISAQTAATPTTGPGDLSESVEVVSSSSGSFSPEALPASDVVWASRAIIAASAANEGNYFRRMFESNFREKDQRRFRIEGEDVNSEAFRTLLRFMYTGDESVVTSENAIDLLEVADRFVVDELKLILEAYLSESFITLDTAPYLLAASDRFHAWRLKRCVVNFLERAALEAAEHEDKEQAPRLMRRLCASDGFDQLEPQMVRELDYLCSKAGACNTGAMVRMAGAAIQT